MQKNWNEDDDDQFGVSHKESWAENTKGQKVKTTTTYQQITVKTRVPKGILQRRSLSRFGDAKIGEEAVTIAVKDFIPMEHPMDILTDDIDDKQEKKGLMDFIIARNEREANRVDGIEPSSLDAFSQSKTGLYQPPAGGDRTGIYVPPNRGSGGDSRGEENSENTLRVSNLSKRVCEEDLKDLFGAFGRIFRVSLPREDVPSDEKDSSGNWSGKMIKQPRGFAFIAYNERADAERALEKLQGHGYDHLILHLEWAQKTKEGAGGAPSRGGFGGRGGGLSGGYVSGYGGRLAQDSTTHKVSYASNLTANR